MPEQITKLKKKQWYPIVAPIQFDNAVLGETLVYEPQAMLGKTLSHSLMNLKNDVKKQNVNIQFKVIGVEGDKAITSIIGYKITSSSVKRFVRRDSEKIDISFTCETSDNLFLRVKPLIVTKSAVKGSVAAKLRNSTVLFLSKTIKKMTYDEIINDLISHKLQEMMRGNLNKTYPLKVCEIRFLGIETRRKPEEIKQVKEKHPEVKVEINEEK